MWNWALSLNPNLTWDFVKQNFEWHGLGITCQKIQILLGIL